MNKIHIIPTDKPSRLFLKENTLLLNNQYTLQEVFPKGKCQNIYITSDVEIKEGDWVFGGLDGIDIKKYGKYFAEDWKKIILTTDQDLIKDGVQDIDDNFLEWFVKNPSCDEVEVGYGWIRLTETDNEGYWVSIPDKQFEMQQEEPKQETLEEIAESKYGTDMDSIRGSNVYDLNTDLKRGFIEGAKWMQERMYSEEDMKKYASYMLTHTKYITPKEWFEQFKKNKQ
jgi:hypothetical protein